jgi:hypothetical protein
MFTDYLKDKYTKLFRIYTRLNVYRIYEKSYGISYKGEEKFYFVRSYYEVNINTIIEYHMKNIMFDDSYDQTPILLHTFIKKLHLGW